MKTTKKHMRDNQKKKEKKWRKMWWKSDFSNYIDIHTCTDFETNLRKTRNHHIVKIFHFGVENKNIFKMKNRWKPINKAKIRSKKKNTCKYGIYSHLTNRCFICCHWSYLYIFFMIFIFYLHMELYSNHCHDSWLILFDFLFSLIMLCKRSWSHSRILGIQNDFLLSCNN